MEYFLIFVTLWRFPITTRGILKIMAITYLDVFMSLMQFQHANALLKLWAIWSLLNIIEKKTKPLKRVVSTEKEGARESLLKALGESQKSQGKPPRSLGESQKSRGKPPRRLGPGAWALCRGREEEGCIDGRTYSWLPMSNIMYHQWCQNEGRIIKLETYRRKKSI